MSSSHGLVHVMRQNVELASAVPVDAVITGTGPVPVVVDQCHIEGQEPEQAVDVENGFQRLFEFVGRCLFDRTAQRDQGLPGLGMVL